MRVSSALWASALFAVGANAMVDVDHLDRVRGLAIEREWLVSALMPAEHCDTFTAELKAFAANPQGVRSDGDESVSDLMNRAETCIAAIHGSEEVANAAVDYALARLGVDAELAQAIKASTTVEPDTVVTMSVTRNIFSFGIDRVDQTAASNTNAGSFTSDFTGAGQNIYIVDTGLFINNNEFNSHFGNRATVLQSFVPGENAVDGNGHGTHCAGTAASNYFGVAHEAKVFGVKVLGNSGSGSNQGVINGLNFAASHAEQNQVNGVGVISMSLGGGRSAASNRAVNAIAARHAVVVAAGNDAADACNFSPAGAGGNVDNSRNGCANNNECSNGVISVGSVTFQDQRSSFSNFGQCVDIWAPGSSITSTWFRTGDRNPVNVQGGTPNNRNTVSFVNTISGTSMACPHVSGAMALFLQKHNGDVKAARADLLASAQRNAIGGLSNQDVNLMLQVPKVAENNSPTPAPPTPAPTNPPVATNPPGIPASWRCPVEFYNSRDGCDCDCADGGRENIDPDCFEQGQALFCAGRRAPRFTVCVINTNQCVRDWRRFFLNEENGGEDIAPGQTFAPTSFFDEENTDNKELFEGIGGGGNGDGNIGIITPDQPSENKATPNDIAAVVGAAVGVAAVVAGVAAFVVVRRRRSADAGPQIPQDGPMVSSGNPHYQGSY